MAKILVVDDEHSVRITIREFLLEENHEVNIADNVETALSILKKQAHDVVVTDIIMPSISGIQLLKKIREVSPDIQVIMITGEPSVETAAEAVRSGAFEYLSKPIKDEEIKAIVNKAAEFKKLIDDKKKLEKENEAYQKQLEEMVIKRTNQLVDTQQKFEMAVEGSANGLWIRNFETEEDWVSRQYARLLGYEPEEFNDSYADWTNRLHPDDRDRIITLQNHHLTESTPYSVEYRLKTKSGEYKWFSATGVAIRDHRNQPLKMAGSIQDITVKKESEEKLLISERRFKELADSLPQLIFELDKNFVFNYINQFGLDSTEYKINDILDNFSFLNLVDTNEIERTKNFFDLVLKSQNKIELIETAIVKKNGESFPVVLYARPIINKDKAIGIRGFVLDQSKQKESEIIIRKLSRSVEQSPVLIIITNIDGTIEYVNPRFSEVTGFSYEEAVGSMPSIVKSGKTPKEVYKNMWSTILSGKEWKGELLNKKKNGMEYWESLSISPIKDANGTITHFLGIKEDITNQKKLVKDLREAKDKAEIADRLKSEFLAQMSHEIRTPINAIVSFSNLLKDELKIILPEDLKMGFNIIDKAGRRIIRTIDLLLNLSEIQAGTYDYSPNYVDICGEVLSSLVLEFKPLALEKSINFEFNIETEQTEIYADVYTVIQIFNNLLDNAVKFTIKGKISVFISKPADNLIVTIKDTGIGISEEYLPKIFQPFTQEDQGYTRKFEGNGIGLLLVKKFCEMNNIDIKISSIKNEGTTIILIFP